MTGERAQLIAWFGVGDMVEREHESVRVAYVCVSIMDAVYSPPDIQYK